MSKTRFIIMGYKAYGGNNEIYKKYCGNDKPLKFSHVNMSVALNTLAANTRSINIRSTNHMAEKILCRGFARSNT